MDLNQTTGSSELFLNKTNHNKIQHPSADNVSFYDDCDNTVNDNVFYLDEQDENSTQIDKEDIADGDLEANQPKFNNDYSESELNTLVGDCEAYLQEVESKRDNLLPVIHSRNHSDATIHPVGLTGWRSFSLLPDVVPASEKGLSEYRLRDTGSSHSIFRKRETQWYSRNHVCKDDKHHHDNDGISPGGDVPSVGEEVGCFYRARRLIRKFRNHQAFRRKFTYSLFLIWAFFVLGWRLGQLGPSLLDLQIITNVSFEMAAYYVTSLCAGYMCGGLLGGFLYDRFNKVLLMFTVLCGLSVVVTVIPWCRVFYALLVMEFLEGLLQGCIDTVTCAEIVGLWNSQTGQSFMQAIHFGFGCGGIISPLITAPFLAEVESEGNIHGANNTGQFGTTGNLFFTSTTTIVNNITCLNYSTVAMSQQNGKTVESSSGSMLHVAYAISGVMIFLSSLPFLVIYVHHAGLFERHKSRESSKHDRPLPLPLKVFVIFVMSMMSALYTGLEETFVEFLSAFCVEQLNWTKTQGSLSTSLYFGTIGFGHLINIFIVRIFNQIHLMGVYCFMLVIVLGSMTMCATQGLLGAIWLAPPLVGLSLSVIYPIIFTWTEDIFMPVTGRISSIFILTGALGSLVNPPILGRLMEQETPMWFCYLLLLESVVQLLFFLLALLLTKVVQRNYRTPVTKMPLTLTK